MAAQSSIIQKSIAILDLLGDAMRPQTFTQIVKASAFNKSTVHRLLVILTSEGLVQHDENTKTYMLGHKLLGLARKARRGFDIQTIAFDEMQRLHDLVQQNVTIGVLKGDEVIYLRVIEAAYAWGLILPPGMREPVHSTATGKALVAFLPPRTISAWLDNHILTRFTDRTITARVAFEIELENVRKKGFATSDRENVEYVNGIAAPIFNYIGEPVAALNIWAPADRGTFAKLLGWSDELKAAAERISGLIGANPTDAIAVEQIDREAS